MVTTLSTSFPAFYAALTAAGERVDLELGDMELSGFSPDELDSFAEAESQVQLMPPSQQIRVFDGDENGNECPVLAAKFPDASHWAGMATNDVRFLNAL